MDDKFIGSIKQVDSEICFFICEQDKRYYAKVFDSDVLKESKNPDNAVLLLDITDLEKVIYILSHPINRRGNAEWDLVINSFGNVSLHLRRINIADEEHEYDLRKYYNSYIYTGWLKAGITFKLQHIREAIKLLKLSMKELCILDKRYVSNIWKEDSTEYNILDDIFSDFDL